MGSMVPKKPTELLSAMSRKKRKSESGFRVITQSLLCSIFSDHNIIETAKVGFYVYSLRAITSLAQGHIQTASR